MLPSQRSNHSRRGLTLTEAVIYLAIVGFILGAVWATGAMVTRRQSINTARNDVIQIVQNIRTLYKNTLHFSGTGAFAAESDITAPMVNAAIFPLNMFNNGSTTPHTPWQTPVTLSVGAAGALNTFVIQLSTSTSPLPTDACRDLASTTTGPARDSRLIRLSINGTDYTGAALEALDPTTIADLANCTYLTYVFSF